jgi:hypothetical protein
MTLTIISQTSVKMEVSDLISFDCDCKPGYTGPPVVVFKNNYFLHLKKMFFQTSTIVTQVVARMEQPA